jgi:hypothetical protein
MRVLSISTLFPSPAPGFGQFVANQMSGVADLGGVTVINPIGVPPWPLSGREPYRTLAACPRNRTGPIDGAHPRFTLIPVIGGDSNPRVSRARSCRWSGASC